jgi:hypothetical protein
MRTIDRFLWASAVTLGICVSGSLAGQSANDKGAADDEVRMVVVKNKDVSGTVLKRLGLPSQNYCWEQCLKDDRCTGTRWGALAKDSPGQCQLMSGELTFGELHALKTEDGQRIIVTAARKESTSRERRTGKSGV